VVAVLGSLYVIFNVGFLVLGFYRKRRELDKWHSKSEPTAYEDNELGILEYHLDLTLT
jgi:hypothetical protein